MKKNIKVIIYSLVCGLLTFGASSLALAATPATTAVNPRTKLDAVAGGSGIGLNGSFPSLTGTIILGVLAAAGVIFLIMIFYAGLLWLLAQGDTTKIQKAKTLMVYSVLGLVIMFLAYGITYFLINSILFGKLSASS